MTERRSLVCGSNRTSKLVCVFLHFLVLGLPLSLASEAAAEESLETEVERDRLRFTEAVELADRERYDEALPIFEELQLHRPHAVILYNIAWCRSRLGMEAAALEAFDEYLELEDSSEERGNSARDERDRLFALLGRPDVAEPVDEEGDGADLDLPENPPVEAEPDAEPPRNRRRLAAAWFWSSLGLSLVTGAAAIVTGALTWEMRRQWIEEANGDSRTTGLQLRTATDILLLALVSEAVTTLVLGLFTDFSVNSSEEEQTPFF